MIRLILWARMVGFTALFVSVPLGYLAYNKRPYGWLRGYLTLIAAQAIFDLTFTFVVFSDILFHDGPQGSHPFFTILQALVSFLLLYVVPRFVQRLVGTAHRRWARLWGVVPAALLLLAYIFVFIPAVNTYSTVISVLFYTYLFGWHVYGVLGHRRFRIGQWQPWILAYLVVASLFYLLVGLEVGFHDVLLTQEPPLPSRVLVASIFNAIWGILVIVPSIQMLSQDSQGVETPTVSEEFVREFGLSRREAEVLEQLCLGLTNKDIAEALFVSPRTVENHVYSLYRKCGVRRRLELSNLLRRYA